jgi:polysaccharide export outer membrane protein
MLCQSLKKIRWMAVWISWCATSLFLTGCQAPPSGFHSRQLDAEVWEDVGSNDEGLVYESEALQAHFRPLVRPGIMLQVEVLVAGRKEIDERSKRVNSEGQLVLPLIGAIEAAGLTLPELNRNIQAAYGSFFRDPQVVVEFQRSEDGASSPWGYVTVLGRVARPGRMGIPPTQDMRVSTAIQQAGGLASSARDTAIRVSRTLPDGEMRQFTVNMRVVGRDGQAEADMLLIPGDVVFVPEAVF